MVTLNIIIRRSRLFKVKMYKLIRVDLLNSAL